MSETRLPHAADAIVDISMRALPKHTPLVTRAAGLSVGE